VADEHRIELRDMRALVDGEAAFSADCSCGWIGELHQGPSARIDAQREGQQHLERERQELDPIPRE
jgi:hypothetical protein